MRFKFKGIPVKIVNGEVICDDELVSALLRPAAKNAWGAPEKGDPYLNELINLFGKDSLTGVKHDHDGGLIVY